MSNDLYYSGNYQKAAFGEFGLRIISSGGSSTGGEQYNAIQVVDDATISCTNAATGGDTSISSLELVTGMIIYGSFHTISVSAGKIIAYIE
tara:strand:- start:47 stop:319 length:273 start_codon:yes stop_codon:yes gene_type:complete